MEPRKNHEPPKAIASWGWRYHHIGIPTTFPQHGERYIEHLKIHVKGFETSPFGIEWMRFDEDCIVSEHIRNKPHLAFEVDNLDEALLGFEVIYAQGSPSEGVRCAMILYDGSPVELIEFSHEDTMK
jgi:hypothetical protein